MVESKPYLSSPLFLRRCASHQSMLILRNKSQYHKSNTLSQAS